MKTTVRKAIRIAAAWALLGAILACGGNDDDAPPPVAPTAPTTPTPPPPAGPARAADPARAAGHHEPEPHPRLHADPQTARGQAGGTVMSNTLDPSCSAGRVPTAPQHSVTLTQDFANLRIMVNSQHDTTLAIREPDGTYRCNDDGQGTGLDPLNRGGVRAAGTYQVYVGTFTGNAEPCVIGFSEVGSAAGQPRRAPDRPRAGQRARKWNG